MIEEHDEDGFQKLIALGAECPQGKSPDGSQNHQDPFIKEIVFFENADDGSDHHVIGDD